MIYLDVTSSCTSELNTGMQRMTRRIFSELSKRVPTMPLYWNRIGKCYQQLGPVERRFLISPFEAHPKPAKRPELRGENAVVESKRLVTLPRFDLVGRMGANDIFLSPDTHHDSRREHFPQWLKKMRGHSVAIFHDAARCRLRALYGRRARLQAEYIESLSNFHLVICISRETKTDLLDFWNKSGCNPTRTCVEPWAVELEEQPLSSHRSDLILCVSSFDPRKNHFTLLQAAETLWSQGFDFELCLVGTASVSFGWRVVHEIRRLHRAGRRIRWLCHIDDHTLMRQYSRCRFTVYPSFMEGFGLPIVESLFHGKPCVCGGNGALGEVAAGGGCLITDQTDSNAVAVAMRRLLSDEQLYRDLARQARSRKFRHWTNYMNALLAHLGVSQQQKLVMASFPSNEFLELELNGKDIEWPEPATQEPMGAAID